MQFLDQIYPPLKPPYNPSLFLTEERREISVLDSTFLFISGLQKMRTAIVVMLTGDSNDTRNFADTIKPGKTVPVLQIWFSRGSFLTRVRKMLTITNMFVDTPQTKTK